jgi:hypothetical protein
MSTDGSTGGASTGAEPSTGGAGSTAASTGAAAFMGWNDGWRHEMAKSSTDPEKELKQLERYESPTDVWRKARGLERKMSAGELRAALPQNPTSEELTRWRADNGIPSKPEDYKITMPDGKAAPEEDDDFLIAFRKSAHDSNYTQAQFDRAVATFYSEVDRQQQLIGEAEEKAVQDCEEKLRTEWGPQDYRVNKAMAEALLARAPQGFRDRFMNGTLHGGVPIRASVEAWKWLVQMEREINPAATVLPGGTGDLGKTIDAEIADLKKMMANSNGDYWKGPKAESLQARYRDLVEAKHKLKERAA